MAEMTLDDAIQSAIELRKAARDDEIYQHLEKAVRAFEKDGYPLESIIPKGGASQLGALRKADGKRFLKIYCALIRKSLCTSNGEFNKLMKAGLQSSVGAILTAVVTTLGIPTIALGVMVPIAVIIANTGVDAFCEMTDEKD